MREQSLLPCPFCGGEPEEEAGCVSEYYGHEHQNYSISCKGCGAEVYCNVGAFDGADVPCSCHYDARKVCVDKWNMRHIAAPAVQAEQLSVDTLTNVLRNAPVAPSDSQGNKRVNSPVIPDGWLAEAERLAELHGASFVLFRHRQEPVCADPSKFWFGYDPAAPEKDFREMPNSSTNNCRENAETSTKCWIPVSERMPDETQPVIVVADGGVVQRTVYQFCDGVWIDWYEQYDEVPHDAFTHWMPLPAAPKQEAE